MEVLIHQGHFSRNWSESSSLWHLETEVVFCFWSLIFGAMCENMRALTQRTSTRDRTYVADDSMDSSVKYTVGQKY